MKKDKISDNVKIILEILQNEIEGNVFSAMNKLAKDYSMTWMYKNKKGVLFPRTSNDVKSELKKVYLVRGRKYDIKNIAEGNKVVMIEMTESYPDPKTKKVYRTPLVIVLEMKNGKIRKGRHYCDPDISYLYLSKKQIDKAF
jgi:ketosteroid isomerase-like protein